MEKSTTYKRTLSGSVGAGLGSVFNRAGGKTYYILEHKVSSKYHKAGEAQEIIVDQIEIGRDYRCQVQFDESFNTVSRRHAAIVRDGDNWKLIQLSKTNKTFLNGHSVENEWYLQNGDEIQLSVNGPKLGFIIPQGNKAKTGSIALSRRLSLFRQQALRPYKAAMTAMACVIALLLVCGGGAVYYQHKKIEILDKKVIVLNDSLESAWHAAEDARREQAKAEKDYTNRINKLEKRVAELQNNSERNDVVTPTPNNGPTTGDKTIDKCIPFVYFILSTVEYEINGQKNTYRVSGTGFLLRDGRFVTARHVVEPWMYIQSENDMYANMAATLGISVSCQIDAFSPDGKHLKFKASQSYANRQYDEIVKDEDSGLEVTIPSRKDMDWAYFMVSPTDGLAHDNELSKSLPMQAELTILGYPLGLGANSKSDVHPVLSKSLVAKQGLENGRILTTDTGFESGNSGGPVFAKTKKGGDLIVVGLVSAGAGRSTGFVVPIGNLK